MRYKVCTERPDDFSPAMEVAGCYCVHGDKILFLKRQQGRPHPHTWCLPGGKLEKGETPRAAIIREVYEEVGVKIPDEALTDMGPLYMCLPEMDYIFYLFHTQFAQIPALLLAQNEHAEARWVTPTQALQLPLIIGGKEALDYYREFVKPL